MVQCKAVGDDEGANRVLDDLKEYMGIREIYIERYYDQHMAFYSLNRFYS
jgi:CO dehydrogenase/acetyl-CoA synthase epsilon subunit